MTNKMNNNSDTTTTSNYNLKAYSASDEYNWNYNNHSYIDVYDLHMTKTPTLHQRMQQYSENPERQFFRLSNDTDEVEPLKERITVLHPIRYYEKSDYVLMPVKLTTSRKYDVRIDDLDNLMLEAAKQDNAIFVGEVAGVAPIREMIDKTGDENNLAMHPFKSLNPIPAEKMMSAVLERNWPHNSYTEHFAPMTDAEGNRRKCNFWNCSVCHGGEEDEQIKSALKEVKSSYVLKHMLGLSINNQAAVRYYKAQIVKPYKQMLKMLKVMDLIDELDALDEGEQAIDYEYNMKALELLSTKKQQQQQAKEQS